MASTPPITVQLTAPEPWRPPGQLGDSDPSVAEAKAKLAAFSYGRAYKQNAARTPKVTEEFLTALVRFQKARNEEIRKGLKPGPVMNTDGVLDWATKKQLVILPGQAPVVTPPPVIKRRHAALVFRGTGGVIDQDYVYELARQADLEIIYLDFPASMGGLPPGAPGQPSAQDAVEIGYRAAAAWIKANPDRTFQLYGYSLGEIVVARILEELFSPMDPELGAYRHNYVASVHIGAPARPLGGAFYGGTAAPGVGIASHRLPAAIYAELGARACYLVHPDDMYGSIPVPIPGGTGDIMETVYDMVTELDMSQFLDTIGAMLPHILEIAQDAGIFGALGLGGLGALTGPQGAQPALGGLGGLIGGAGALGGALGGGLALLNPLAMVPMLLPLFVGALPGLIAGIGGGVGGNLTGPAAAAQAAILGMKFLVAGTRPHIEYHIREVWPGQTYFGLGVQHARFWAGEVPVR